MFKTPPLRHQARRGDASRSASVAPPTPAELEAALPGGFLEATRDKKGQAVFRGGVAGWYLGTGAPGTGYYPLPPPLETYPVAPRLSLAELVPPPGVDNGWETHPTRVGKQGHSCFHAYYAFHYCFHIINVRDFLSRNSE